MKTVRIFAALLILIAAGAAVAMEAASPPTKFSIWWGQSAGSPYIRDIPTASQIGVQNCRASLTDGFPPLTFTPPSAGGCPPFGQDMNGILRQLSQWARWQGAGAGILYDATFSAAIGGYPAGAVLLSATNSACTWISTVNNNATNPDGGGAGWLASCPAGGVAGVSTGTANLQIVTATPVVIQRGTKVSFVAGFQNTGSLQINVNSTGAVDVYRKTQFGAAIMVGGEVAANQIVQVEHDGSRWQCMSCAPAYVGQMIDYPGTSATAGPYGYLFTDGSCFPTAPVFIHQLFLALGTTYGTCGADTFRIPDTRGTVTAGPDNQGLNGAANRLTVAGNCAGTTLGALCNPSGQTVTLGTANLPPYTPTGVIDRSAFFAAVGIQSVLSNDGTVPATKMVTGGATAVVFSGDMTFIGVPQGGTSTAFSSVQPTTIIPKLIKF